MKTTTMTAAITPKTLTQRGVAVGEALVLGGSATALRYVMSRPKSSRIFHEMPRLWRETIEEHRRDVGDAILETTASLVAERGLRSVTMSEIAERTGIGRATLYKYYPSVEAILLAWHERRIGGHLEYLASVRDQSGGAAERLELVLEAYALIRRESRGHHDAELAAFRHGDGQVATAQQQLRAMIRDLVAEGARSGELRDDVAADELAIYCLHALGAASTLPSKAAVRRLVAVTLVGLGHRP